MGSRNATSRRLKLSCRSTKQKQISSGASRSEAELGRRVSWARTHAAILKLERTEDSRDPRNFNSLDSRGAGIAVVGPVSLWLAPCRAESTTAEHRCQDWQLLGRFAPADHHRIWPWIRWGLQLTQVWEPSSQPPSRAVLCTKYLCA